jgi:uncharacterized protein
MNYPPIRQPEPLNKRILTVEGAQKLSIQPNIAELELGVEERNENLSKAQQENARKINQIIQALLSLGISQANIQTVDYTIFPLYDYIDGSQLFRGYQVRHTLLISIEDLNQTGAIIDTAIQQGANHVSKITFTLKNMDFYYQQALKGALENATAKAQTISNAMGVTLNPIPFQISEQSTMATPTPRPMLSDTGVVAGISTPIEPGRLDVEAKLDVKYYY